MINLAKKLSPLLLLGLLSGCSAVLPGMSVSYNPPADVKNSSNEANPTMVPINAAVIQQFAGQLNPYVYRIGVGDQLSITVWGHPEFSSPAGQPVMSPSSLGATQSSGTQLSGITGVAVTTAAPSGGLNGYLVNNEGNIFFPFLGYVHLAGLSEQEASALMTQKLNQYIKNPQVIVQVGGFSSQKVYVLGDLSSNATTQGATALVPINETPMTLAYALSAVGGINQTTADTSQIYVIRGSYTHPTVYWLNAESPTAMLYADNFPLMNHDVVFVSTAGIVRFNNVLNQILPLVQTVWFTKELVNP